MRKIKIFLFITIVGIIITCIKDTGIYEVEMMKVKLYYTITFNNDGSKLFKYLEENIRCAVTQVVKVKMNNHEEHIIDKENEDNCLRIKASCIRKYDINSIKKIEEINVWDKDNICANYLIKHINHCVYLKNNSPFCQHLSFEQFCDYILPIKISRESLIDWHLLIDQSMIKIKKELKGVTNIFQAVQIVDDNLEKIFRYDGRYLNNPFIRNAKQLIESGKGTCDDMCHLEMFVLRHFGIPCSHDYLLTTKSGKPLGHGWLCIHLKGWNFVPFEAFYGKGFGIIGRKDSPAYYRKLSYLNDEKDNIEVTNFYRALKYIN
ncbi:transglutaminase domain-containing protein [Puteibacter caeruleilacunae]|nr:transglutaminase domain-containing protein [Puteibacter caeruleilacunae]